MNLQEKIITFFNNRWLVFVVSMWVQCCSGIGYLFGSISPVIKSSMGYTQRQVAILGVAKNLAYAIAFISGSLCEVLPIWGVLFIGVAQNFVGYGLVWLIVSHTLPALPLWVLCICIFVATNSENYFNAGTLVSNVQNFPQNRGPVVGILKGYAGLSGAILTQVLALINDPNQASLIFVVAVGPSMVVMALMFSVRPVGGDRQVRPSGSSGFFFTYCVCLILAAYLLGVLLVQDLFDLNQNLLVMFTALLIMLIILPIVIPVVLVFFSEPRSLVVESLLLGPQPRESSKSDQDVGEIVFSEAEVVNASDVDLHSATGRQNHISPSQDELFQAAAEETVVIKQSKDPHIGEDFTLLQALVQADYWLIFISLILASGSGLTIIDNVGQMCQSLGYNNTHIFVSMISIWNFLGRVGGGYISEIIVRNYSYPRPVAMAVVQVFMAMGLFFYAMSLPGAIYVVSVLIGLGYGALWAIVPAAVSELFGLRSFGALSNFLVLASPIGSFIFSGIIASGIYDYEAEQQNPHHERTVGPVFKILLGVGEEDSLACYGSICYSLTCGIMSGLCFIAVVLSLIVVHRTKRFYSHVYRSSRI